MQASNSMMDKTRASGRYIYQGSLTEALINMPGETDSLTSCDKIFSIIAYGTSKSSMWEFVYFMFLLNSLCVCVKSQLHTLREAVDLICILILSCQSPSCGPREMRNTTEQ